MKTEIHRPIQTLLVGFALASIGALTPPVTARAAAPSGPAARSIRAVDDNSVAGSITRKSDFAIVVDEQAIAVSSATAITKGGATLRLSDLNLGDKVLVDTIRSEDGRLLAFTIDVTSDW